MKRHGRQRLRDARAETQLFRSRAMAGLAIAALAIAALGARFGWLQVASYQEFQSRSEANRIKPRPIVPARGLIFDRNGRLLADNVPAYRLELVPEQVRDIPATLDALAEVVSLDAEERERFDEALGAKRRFQAVPIKLRLTEDEVARFAINRHRFPGVEVVPHLVRHYPYGELFAHVVGYVGRIDAGELARLDETRYAGTTHVGKSGIEARYEDVLHGSAGFEQVEINAEGRTLRVLEREPAVPGTHLYLSIDADLQAATVAAFEGQPGAAVAIDPRSGEVLAQVSLPSFDPNAFVFGISHADYAALLASPGRPLFDRTVQGGYAPGSTLKPFFGLAGLEYGARSASERVFSSGGFRLPNQERSYGDWKPGGHGWVDLEQALAQSVNTYFYGLAVELGIERLSAFMARFGFGRPTGIDLPGELGGILPSPEWKRADRNQPWYPGETVIAGIGQGFWVVTPLQLAQATAMLAAGGVQRTPHLLRAVQDPFRGDPALLPLPQPQPLGLRDPAHLAAVTAGMVAVMHAPTGTARAAAKGAEYRIAGKTGTAQRVGRAAGEEAIDVNDLPFHLRHSALFVAFAPAEDPEIALALVIEHGGSGSAAAAPVARRILDAWIERQQAQPALAEGAR
jgi:penicillin-binding protein 2